MPITPEDIPTMKDGERVAGYKGTCEWCGGAFVGAIDALHCGPNHAAYARQGIPPRKAEETRREKASKLAEKMRKLAASVEKI